LDGPVLAVDVDHAVKLLAEADALRAEAAALLGPLEGSGLAEWCGYVSLPRMVAHRAGVGNAEAGRVCAVAVHIDRFSATRAALESGRIGWSHAEALAKAAEGLADRYRLDEEQLLGLAASVEVEELVRFCRLWRARADAEAAAADAEHRHTNRGLWMQFAFDGSCTGRFRLDADGADIVARAVESQPDSSNGITTPRTLAQRQADALVEACEAFLATTADGAGGSRATVDVVIDAHTLAGAEGPIEELRAELSRGAPISGPGLDRLLCDASFRALVTDGPRTVLAYNRATPAIPPALRRAVRLRDRGCQFHGCDRPWHWCDLHHLIPRHRGGPTSMENLAVVCRFHHTLVHEGGWQLTRGPDGAIVTTSP
jgi:hypothetical protein